MPKEVFVDLINKRDYFLLLINCSVYLLNWTVMLKLGLTIIQFKVSTKKLIFPWALFGVIYSLFFKLFIPEYIYVFTSLFLLCFLLKNISKFSLSKACYAALLSLLTAIISFFLVGQPLLINDRFRPFLLGPKGTVIGSLTESILPVISLLFFQHSRLSQEKKKIYFPSIAINLALLFIVYCFFAIIFYLLATYHTTILWQILISEAILICITLLVLIRFKLTIKKEQQRSEENHSTYLLRTILSKQREYRNFFQVIRAMAEKERNQNIVDYIDNIFADMSLAGDCDGVNPIFAACQVAEQIKAKEKGVKISTKTKSPLNNLKEPIKVYDIFRDLLQFFIAYEERFLEDEHQINVEIDETDQDYIFKITRKNGSEKLKGEFITISSPPEGERTLEQIAKRIRKLRGKVYFLYKEDELRGCLFRVAKAKPLNFLFPV